MVIVLMLGLVGWVGFALLVRWVERGNLREGDLLSGVLARLMQVWARGVHALRVEGMEHVPLNARDPRRAGRPLVIVANHTSFLDPLLIQAALPFEVRWIMGEDMALPALRWLWDYARVILVDRRVNESAPLREAIRHVKEGGVIGIFPEGFIERPPRVVYPFKEGVGLVVSRTISCGAVVLPVVIEGTPQVEPGRRALWTRSVSRVRFLGVRDYSGMKMGAGEIAADLRGVFLEATGWAGSEVTPRWEDGGWTDVGLDGRLYRGGVLVG
jgi:1-acyl-sn-glycerol-3-phosphate acyltransferase